MEETLLRFENLLCPWNANFGQFHRRISHELQRLLKSGFRSFETVSAAFREKTIRAPRS